MGSLERVYTGTECREIDRIAIKELGIPGLRLMQRAARFAMTELLKRWPSPNSVSIICGTGNNAGDGYLLAVSLADKKIPVRVCQVGDPSRLRGDAKWAFDSAVNQGVDISEDCDFESDVVVDALLGTGSKGAVRPPYAEAIRKINASSKSVVALDLPSGVDADTGGFLINEPVQANLTTCFVGRKLALLTGRARNVAGDIVHSALGIPEPAYEKVTGLGVLSLQRSDLKLPPRKPSSHKGNYGHVLIIGGNRGMGGAPLLAGEACLRSGAGLVSVLTHPDYAASLLARRPELMVRGTPDGTLPPELVDRAEVVAVGPGLGVDEWAQNLLQGVIATDLPLVVDADALNLLAASKVTLPRASIVTPHPGEAARLLGKTISDIEQNRLDAAKSLSTLTQSVGVLKGAGSLIAQNGELKALCDIAEPALSTAGSGDVLTGVIAGVYAQLTDPLQAACLGVYLHARAGQQAREQADGRAVIASDITDALRPWQ